MSLVVVAAQEDFNIFQHLGGNGQWLPGEELTGISSEVPVGCKVDLAAAFSRHGSRYPDTGAYNGWVDFSKYIQAAGDFKVTNEKLAFLKTWKPVLSKPEAQIANVSPTGWKELHEMGTTWRLRYPDLYEYNTPFTMWANYYTSGPRVRDSARLFAQGFVGPNATDLTTIYALNASDPSSWGNSLAPSDLCKAYNDEGGSPVKPVWDATYLPPITARLNAQIQGDLNLTQSQVESIPYLCGFETQITGRRSPFCDIFTKEEILQYEYAQDLRYWYGTGLGSDIEKYQMLPVVDMAVQRFVDGPNATYKTGNGIFTPPKIMASFTNDGQINQIAAAIGVFDNQQQLPGNMSLPNRLFRSSQIVKMRGTVAFERLSCTASAPNSTHIYPHVHKISNCSTPTGPLKPAEETYMRIRINDVVYPVVNCTSGPGSSCPLLQYQDVIKKKREEAGDFTKLCNMTGGGLAGQPKATFFFDNTLPWQVVVKP
ncbi:histidine acid phosphatase [Pyrenophora seminiperda CCB06]|uniref:Histidine acid phosphatase n=1 Tax=Pyrenophora seminiperda CCB06 TaxID=1302712 RepID=A0A3M7M0H3_9PLEO|nr:histidine acid phosphatase [Pyrenophora seminiperda CCB06]